MAHWTDTIDTDGEWRKVSNEELEGMFVIALDYGYDQSYGDYLVEIVTHGDIVKVNGSYYVEV